MPRRTKLCASSRVRAACPPSTSATHPIARGPTAELGREPRPDCAMRAELRAPTAEEKNGSAIRFSADPVQK